jgi:hypothetical protein
MRSKFGVKRRGMTKIIKKNEHGFLMVGTILSIVIFAGILLMVDTYVVNNLQREALKRVELISAQQVVQFAVAANAYANANSLSTGTHIKLATLVTAGYLYTNFSAANPVGQHLEALVGKKNIKYSSQIPIIVYYNPTNPPPVLGPYKISSINTQAVAAYEMHVATDVAAMQETSPAYASGTVFGSKFQLPYGTSPFAISKSFPGFTSSTSSFADIVNALPSAGY